MTRASWLGSGRLHVVKAASTQEPRFGIWSRGPEAEEDSEKWSCRMPCHGEAATLRPSSMGSEAHAPQEQKLSSRLAGCALQRRSGLQSCAGDPETQALALIMDPTWHPEQLGENKGQTQEAQQNFSKRSTHYLLGTAAV